MKLTRSLFFVFAASAFALLSSSVSAQLAIEITGADSKIVKFLDLMNSFGVLEITRTGKAAMPRK